jgi:hypothetical protein
MIFVAAVEAEAEEAEEAVAAMAETRETLRIRWTSLLIHFTFTVASS